MNMDMITKKIRENLSWTNINRVLLVFVWAISITFLAHVGVTIYQAHEQNQEIRKQTVCPSILSIARSARDTMIVMKAEPLCTEFVLENLN